MDAFDAAAGSAYNGNIVRQAPQEVCDLGGNGGVGKHANLYRINLHIVDDGV